MEVSVDYNRLWLAFLSSQVKFLDPGKESVTGFFQKQKKQSTIFKFQLMAAGGSGDLLMSVLSAVGLATRLGSGIVITPDQSTVGQSVQDQAQRLNSVSCPFVQLQLRQV